MALKRLLVAELVFVSVNSRANKFSGDIQLQSELQSKLGASFSIQFLAVYTAKEFSVQLAVSLKTECKWGLGHQ